MRVASLFSCLLALLFCASVHSDNPLAAGQISVFGSRITVSPALLETPAGVPVFINTTGGALNGVLIGELRGPGISGSVSYQTQPGQPFQLPPLTTKGTYFFENIRLMNGGQFVLSAMPDRVEIRVIEVLITQISSRPLSLEEIRSLGLIIKEEDFSAVSFEVGLSFSSTPVKISFPLLLPKKPSLQPVIPPPINNVGFTSPVAPRTPQGIAPSLPSFVPFTFTPSSPDFNFDIPDIPGVIVFPNEIAFLNQFFAVVLMVRNGASEGSSLSVEDLTAQMVFDPDDVKLVRTNPVVPLGSPVPVRHPGSDGQVGTGDDIDLILAGQTAQSEFFVEGLTEGTHTVRMNLRGTLHGLVQGDIPVTGVATGAILVRNPNFAITFSHPSVVQSGQPYDLFITVTNTSNVDANLVRLSMPANALVNCVIQGNSYQDFEVIKPGESETARFVVEPRVTGQVTSGVISSPGSVTGQFQFRVGVGEKGIPLSPNTLILPEFARALGPELVEKGLNVLGLAYSAATAPPGGLPPGVPHISKNAVFQRAVEMAQAGQRYTLATPTAGESRTDTISHLLLDWLGNTARDDDFDVLLRSVEKGRDFYDFIFETMNVGNGNAMEFHYNFGDATFFRNPFFSAMLQSSGASPVVSVTDSVGRTTSSAGGEFGPALNIPYSNVLRSGDGAGSVVWTLIGSVPAGETYTLSFTGNDKDVVLSVLIPVGTMMHRVTFPSFHANLGTQYRLVIDLDSVTSGNLEIVDGLGVPVASQPLSAVNVPSLQAISAVQDAKADRTGHIIGLLFNQPLEPQSTLNLSNYKLSGNNAVDAKLQDGGRILYLAFRNPVSPLVDSDLTISNLKSVLPGSLPSSPQTIRIHTTVSTDAGMVSGRVLGPDGAPIPLAPVQLKEVDRDDLFGEATLHVTAETMTNANGEYSFDYVRMTGETFKVVSQDPFTGYLGDAVSIISQPRQLLRLDVIMLGRGTVRGRVVKNVEGALQPVAGAIVTGLSLTEAGARSVLSDVQGNYVIEGLAVGPINLTAQNPDLGSPEPYFGAATTTLAYAGSVAVRDIEIVHQAAGRVLGRVLQSNMIDPITDAYILLTVPVGNETLYLTDFSDGEGNFVFEEVPAGLVTVTAKDRVTGRTIGTISVNVTSGYEAQISIVSQGTGSIRVLLAYPNEMSVSQMVMWVEGTAEIRNPVQSLPVVFENIPVGRWTVKVNNIVTGDLISGSVVIPYSSYEASIALEFQEKGTVHGIARQVDGAPASGSTILIFTGALQDRLAGVATAGANGEFAFPNLDYGSYTVHAISTDQNDGGSSQKVTIDAFNRNRQADVTFKGKGTITARVYTISDTGEEVAPVVAPVRLETVTFDYDGRIRRPLVITRNSNTDGNVTFTNIFRGGFRVVVSTPITAGGIVSGILDSPTKHVDIELSDLPGISGVVHDADGNLVQATVTVRYPDYPEIPEESTTSFGGHFSFTSLKPHKAYFRANAGGIMGDLTIGIGKNNPDIDIHLLGSGGIYGMIKDAAGRPVPNAFVELKVGGLMARTLTGQANAEGIYNFGPVPEGHVTVKATNGNTTGRGGISIVHNASVSLDITLSATATVTGVLYQFDGTTPVPNADVLLQRGGTSVAQFTSGASGDFTFDTSLGTYTLAALDKNSGRRAASPLFALTSDGEVVTKNLVLEGQGTVLGFVYDYTGQTLIAGARLTLFSEGVVERRLLGSSGADGSFEFAGVPTGPFTITATSGLLSGQSEGNVNQDGQIIDTEVLLQESASIDGQVIFNNGSLPTGVIPIITLKGRGIDLRIDAPNGRFQVENLPLGQYSMRTRFTYQDVPYRGVVVVPITSPGTTDVSLRLLGMNTVEVTIAGTLLDITTVTLKYNNQMEAETTITHLQGTDNVAVFNLIPESNFTVTVRSENTQNNVKTGSAAGTISGDGGVIPVAVQLAPSGTVRGRLVNASGQPVEDVSVKLESGSLNLFTFTDILGQFQFEGVPASLAGQPGTPFTLSAEDFTHGGKARVRSSLNESEVKNYDPLVLDTIRPVVVSTIPSAGQTAVPVNTPIQVVFSEPMDDPALRNAFKLTSSTGTVVGALEINGATATLTGATLLPQQTYTISLASTAEDLAGNSLASAFAASFSTIDTVPPVLTLSLPIHMAYNVPVNTAVTLFFSEPIANSQPGPDPVNITVTGSVSGIATAEQSWNATRTSVALHFTRSFEQNEHVIAAVSNYKDAAGNTGLPATIEFDTIDTQPPNVLSVTPSANSIREGTSVTITATVDESFSTVDFFVKGVLQFRDTVAPFHFAAPPSLTTIAANGSDRFVVQAQAIDRSGNASQIRSLDPNVTLLVDNPPMVTIQSMNPLPPNISPGQTLQVNYVSTDDGSVVQNLIIVTGGHNGAVVGGPAGGSITLPLSTPTGSSLFVKVRATDDASQVTTTTPVNFTVTTDQTPPTVSLFVPATVLVGQTIQLLADGSDNVGITRVEFYADDVLIQPVDTTAPFQVAYSTGNTIRQVTIKAKAYDAAGNVGETQRIVTIDAAGSITGTVVQHDGSTPVPNVLITVIRNSTFFTSKNAGPDGSFALNTIPLGNYRISASHNGDHGSVTTTLSSNGESRNVTVRLFGLGALHVTVLRANGTTVPNAQVSVTSSTEFPLVYNRVTGSDGTVLVPDVLAGPVSVRAVDPITGLVAIRQTTVVADQTVDVTAQFGQNSSLNGTVYAPNGVDPVSGALVKLISNTLTRETSTDGSGNYVFDLVASNIYRVEVYDAASRLRNRVTGIDLRAPGSTATQDLVFIGLGTVQGHVTQGATPVTNAVVTLRSNHPVLGATLSDTTDDQGFYSISNVPVGDFKVSSLIASQQLYGEATDVLQQDSETKTIDLQMISNSVELPEDRFDWNDFLFDVQRNASFQSNAAVASGARLSLKESTGSDFMDFTGPANSIGYSEDSNRELSVSQSELLGLDVSRKVYVPSDGYFARYLEILTNNSVSAINVDVRVRTSFGSNTVANQQTDSWIVSGRTNDTESDRRESHIYYGEGATAMPAVGISSSVLGINWLGVEIPAGETVILMHFVAQQFHNAGAVASAERLAQLPHEALAGLSLEEIARIKNFIVPEDGSSILTPLAVPQKNGTVTGTVFGADSATPVPQALVTFTGSNPYYGSVRTTTANANGGFTFTGVPVDGFRLKAKPSNLNFTSPEFTGSFDQGPDAVQNVTFSNAGIVVGTVTRHNGALVNSGTVQLSNADGSISLSTSIGASGLYTFPVVPPGSYNLVAEAGSLDIFGTQTVTVVAGQTHTANITIEPTGSLTGTVTGPVGAVSGQTVVVFKTGFQRSTITNASGQYTFTDLPADLLTVRALHPTFGGNSAQVQILADQTIQLDLALGKGTIAVQVTDANNFPFRERVYLTSAAGYTHNIFADPQGIATFTDVPLGLFTAKAFHPVVTYAFTEVASALPQQAQPFNIVVRLPAVAAVRVAALKPGDEPLPDAAVQIRDAFSANWISAGTTDSSGTRVIARVPEGAFTVRVLLPNTLIASGTQSGSVFSTDDGDTLDVPVPIFAGTIRGHVYIEGTVIPLPDATLNVFESTGTHIIGQTTSGPDGEYEFANQALDPDGFVIEADLNGNSVRRSGSIATTGETVNDFDFELPVNSIKGTITFANNSPVPNPQVLITTIRYDLEEEEYYPVFTDENGNYMFVDPPIGHFVLTAQDPDSGLFVKTTAFRADDGSVQIINLSLPETVAVTGQVVEILDEDEFPIGAEVAFTSISTGYENRTSTGDGNFTFDAVPVGTILFQACSGTRCGTASVELNPTAIDPIVIRIPGSVFLEGTVFASDGMTGIQHAQVIVQNLDHLGPLEEESLYETSTGSAGGFNASVSSGTIRAIAEIFQFGSHTSGATERTTSSETEVTVDVTLGTAVSPHCHEDGCSYSIADESLQLVGLSVNAAEFGWFGPALPEAGGKQLSFGPSYRAGVHVTRKSFVPAHGRFVRWLEIVKNPTDFDVTVPMRVHGDSGYSQLPVLPEDTQNNYVIWEDPGESALAFVFGGNGALPASALHFEDGTSAYAYGWNLTLGPRQTRMLLHFTVSATDAAAAQQVAEALLNLSELEALEGLTASEQALIVNFNHPGLINGTVLGRVSDSNNNPLAGITVHATDVATEELIASTITDSLGDYAFATLNAGIGGIRITVPFSGGVAEEIVVFNFDGDSARADFVLAASQLSVSGTVSTFDTPNGTFPVPFAHVILSNLSGDRIAAIFTAEDGTYAFEDLLLPQDFRVIAALTEGSGFRDSQDASAGSPVVNLHLPVTWMTGHIYDSFSAPVGDMTVYIEQPDPAIGLSYAFTFTPTAADGSFTLVGVAEGPFTLFVLDQSSYDTKKIVDAAIPDLSTGFSLDVQLPEVANVSGMIKDPLGMPFASSRIGFVDPVTGAQSTFYADASGLYSVDAPIGIFHAQACENWPPHCNTTAGDVPGAGLALDVQIPDQVNISGTVPVASGSVDIFDFTNMGTLDTPVQNIYQGNGSYTAFVSDQSLLRVAARDQAGVCIGAAEQVSFENATINVTSGNVFDFELNDRIVLTDTSANPYEFDGNGTLFSAPYLSSFLASVNHAVSWSSVGILEGNGREIVLGPNFANGIVATRKIYVPEQGGFVRYLEILENRTSSDLTIPVRVNGALDGDAPIVNTGDGYASFNSPAAAVVFGGEVNPIAAQTSFWSGDNRFVYTWYVTIPAGESRILMHFAVPGNATDVNELRNLSHPDALNGITEDLQKIVNFVTEPVP